MNVINRILGRKTPKDEFDLRRDWPIFEDNIWPLDDDDDDILEWEPNQSDKIQNEDIINNNEQEYDESEEIEEEDDDENDEIESSIPKDILINEEIINEKIDKNVLVSERPIIVTKQKIDSNSPKKSLISEVHFKDLNLIIDWWKISNIFEIWVPPMLDEENWVQNTPNHLIDTEKSDVYLNQLQDKIIEYWNIETDLWIITKIDWDISEIMLQWKFFDNDWNNSMRWGKFWGKLCCYIKKTRKGYESVIMMRDPNYPPFLKAAEKTWFTEEEKNEACYAHLTFKALEIYLWEEKYKNKYVVSWLDPKNKHDYYNDDDYEYETPPVFYKIWELNKKKQLTNANQKNGKRTFKVKHMVVAFAVWIVFYGVVDKVKDIVYRDKTTSHPAPLELGTWQLWAEELPNELKETIVYPTQRKISPVITIKPWWWFWKAVEDYVTDNKLTKVPNLKEFVNTAKINWTINLEKVNPYDQFKIVLVEQDNWDWELVKVEKIKI
jgi:hypothetical protein